MLDVKIVYWWLESFFYEMFRAAHIFPIKRVLPRVIFLRERVDLSGLFIAVVERHCVLVWLLAFGNPHACRNVGPYGVGAEIDDRKPGTAVEGYAEDERSGQHNEYPLK